MEKLIECLTHPYFVGGLGFFGYLTLCAGVVLEARKLIMAGHQELERSKLEKKIAEFQAEERKKQEAESRAVFGRALWGYLCLTPIIHINYDKWNEI
jgi:hypothetical protein